jgi:CubicO group peptidase (beta-lactamase class C family)
MITRRAILKAALAAPFLPDFARTLAAQEVDGDNAEQGILKSEDFPVRLEQLRLRFGLPALGAVVVSRNSIKAQGVTGFRKLGELGSVNADAHWQLGSITKTFTGTLIARLIDQGKLNWTSTLGEVFPELVAKMAPNVSSVTVRQLVLHKSGMGSDVIPWEGSPEINVPGLTLSQRRYLFADLGMKQSLSFTPDTQRRYSNQGYNTLGAVAERATGQSWEELVQNELCAPLGIKSVIFGESALSDPESEPWPHRLQREQFVPVPPVPENYYGYHICNPAGGISLTLADFGRWMQAHLSAGSSNQLLTAQSFRTLHSRDSDGGTSPFVVDNSKQGTGRNIAHNGSNGRNSSAHCILLDAGVGVFFATNAAPPHEENTRWFIMNSLFAEGLPQQWPRPALNPPQIPPSGSVEGEALEIVAFTGGGVDFQKFDNLSGKFQLWWQGAKDKDHLVLRGTTSRPGRYAVAAVFAGNHDFGAVTLQLGEVETRFNFRTNKLSWGAFEIGETFLPAGPFDIKVVAHGSAGTNGIVCHLGIDIIRFRYLGET